MSIPTEDKSYKSKNEMLDDLVVLLGGRVAEALVLGDISTGASNDIERASDISRKMVTKYGMSEKLGPIAFGSQNDEVFLGRTYGSVRNYSEKIAADIDIEINEIIKNAYARCEAILNSNMDKLHLVAGYLMENEKASGEVFKALMEGKELPGNNEAQVPSEANQLPEAKEAVSDIPTENTEENS